MLANWRSLCFLIFFITAATAAPAAPAAKWWQTGISLKLKTADFDKFVGKDKHVAIEFYAHFCTYCKLMNDDWDKLAENYMGNATNRSDIAIAKIDGSSERSISTRYGIPSYPTILFFKKGDIFPSDRYAGPRTFEAFKNWVEHQAGPEVTISKEKSGKEDVVQKQEVKEQEVVQKQEIKKPEPVQKQEAKKQETKKQELKEQEPVPKQEVQIKEIEVPVVKSDDLKELKVMLSEINLKLDNKVEPVVSGDINFGQGLSFLILGAFLGVGLSFTLINYKKLGSKKKLLD